MRSSSVDLAVTITIATSESRRSSAQTSSPERSGSMRSSTTRLGRIACARASPSRAPMADRTSWPSRSRYARATSWTERSSSMIKIRSPTPHHGGNPTSRGLGRNHAPNRAPFRTRRGHGKFSQARAQGLRVSIPAACRTIRRVPALIGVGLSHQTAPLALRERLALPPAEATELLHALLATRAADEAVVLSTCNRTELYAVGRDAAAAEAAALRALARRAGMSIGALRTSVAVLRGPEVADHLFAVAGGLESMVLGEAEILGQLRRAHELARAAGACGALLDRLMRDALTAGRRARAGSGIGRCGVSVSSAAVELAREALGSLADRRVLLIGAGKSSEVTAKVMRSHGVRVLSVANRGRERAAAIAGPEGAAVAFEALDDERVQADLVLTATAS